MSDGWLEDWWEEDDDPARLASQLMDVWPVGPDGQSRVLGAKSPAYRAASVKELAELGVVAWARFLHRADTKTRNLEALERFQAEETTSLERHNLTMGAVL